MISVNGNNPGGGAGGNREGQITSGGASGGGGGAGAGPPPGDDGILDFIDIAGFPPSPTFELITGTGVTIAIPISDQVSTSGDGFNELQIPVSVVDGAAGAGGVGAAGENGGFGGGGAGATYESGAGHGGFGGGGGGGAYAPGAGGFGGGGGGGGGGNPESGAPFPASMTMANPQAKGGFGAGTGGLTQGGGGLGAGGDIFVQQGGVLTIEGGDLENGDVYGGSGANSGDAFGTGLFLQGDETISLAPLGGETLRISGEIADQDGAYQNAGLGLPTGDSADGTSNAGVGGLLIDGQGEVVLDPPAAPQVTGQGGAGSTPGNHFEGGIQLESGTLDLAAAGAAGYGTVELRGGTLIVGAAGALGAGGLAIAANETAAIDYDASGQFYLNSAEVGANDTLNLQLGGTAETVDANLIGQNDTVDLTFGGTSETFDVSPGVSLAEVAGLGTGDVIDFQGAPYLSLDRSSTADMLVIDNNGAQDTIELGTPIESGYLPVLTSDGEGGTELSLVSAHITLSVTGAVAPGTTADEGRLIILGTIAGAVAGDQLYLLSSNAPDGIVQLDGFAGNVGDVVVYDAGASGTNNVSYTVGDNFGNTVTSTAMLSVPQPAYQYYNLTATPLSYGPVEPGQTVEVASFTPPHPDDEFEVLTETNLGEVTVVPGNNGSDKVQFLLTVAAQQTATIDYQVFDVNNGAYVFAQEESFTVTVDPGPSLLTAAPQTGRLENGQTLVIGEVEPGIAGDTLSIAAFTSAQGGIVSLGPVLADGVREVIYTAPAAVAINGDDAVSYTVEDQHQDVMVSGTASVALHDTTVTQDVVIPGAYVTGELYDLGAVGLETVAVYGPDNNVTLSGPDATPVALSQATALPGDIVPVVSYDGDGGTNVHLVQTNFTITDAASWNAAVDAIDAKGTDAEDGISYTFDIAPALGTTIALDQALHPIDLDAGSSLTILGGGATLDGGGTERGLFVYAGAVTVEDMAINDMSAAGGAGYSGGGGGAGLGGGLFVTGTVENAAGDVVSTGATVTLMDVSFSNDSAAGGAGSTGFYGGGGGLGGAAGAGGGGGGGGAGLAGLIPTGAAFTAGAGAPNGPAGGGGVGGGGVTPISTTGGAGGFGGGGGGAYEIGGAGGFGGGGGAALLAGGVGGFGGGGGGSAFNLFDRSYTGATGGFGGGKAIAPTSAPYSGAGGGGLGAGGDVFVQQGGQLIIEGGELDEGTVTAGAAGSAQTDLRGIVQAGTGSAFGDGMFIQGDQSVTLAPAAGDALTISGEISDQSGSGGTGADAGAGTLVIAGAGTVTLAATNDYTGGTTLEEGTLVLAAPGASGSGPIVFAGDPVLEFNYADAPAGPIENFGPGSTITIDGFVESSETYDSVSGALILSGLAGQVETTVTLDIPNLPAVAGYAETDTNSAIYEAACYVKGTQIATAVGEVRVEDLEIGDFVETVHAGMQKIKWIGRRSYDGRFIAGNRDILPICIKRHAIAENVPARDLFVSPGHAICIDGALIHAIRLVNGVSVIQAECVETVTYYHIELETHEVIFAENCPAETFLGEDFRQQFQNAWQFSHLYPGESATETMCLPRLDSGFQLHAIQQRIAARAGIPASAAREPGPLRGYVDQAGPKICSGWAQDISAREAPVCIDITVDGRAIGRVLANLFRADLRAAGYGSGYHGFEFSLPPGITGRIDAVRASDRAVLTWTETAAAQAA
jgi:hypothetical protein